MRLRRVVVWLIVVMLLAGSLAAVGRGAWPVESSEAGPSFEEASAQPSRLLASEFPELCATNIDSKGGDVTVLYVPTGGGSPVWSSRPTYLGPGESTSFLQDPCLPGGFAGSAQGVSDVAISTGDDCRPYYGQVPVVLKNYQP